MNVKMEQVEKVRACTGASYAEARAALEQTGGNVLDAVILLEQREKQSKDSGNYSTRHEQAQQQTGHSEWKRPTGRQVRDVVVSLVRNCLSISLEVWRQGELTCKVPLLAAVLLLLVTPYVTLGLFVLGLCFGYRIRVSGQGTEGWGGKVNQVMEQVAGTVYDAVSSIRGDKKHRKK